MLVISYRKSRLLGACAYTIRRNYALNNEISVHQSVHSCAMSVHCIVGVMATQTEETFSIISVVLGHHVYKSVRTPLLGECLLVRSETGNNHDKYTVSVVKHGGIVGNLPRELLRTVWHFILHGGRMTCEVIGKRKLGNGFEVARIHRKMFMFRDIFCWFGINYVPCQSRTLQRSASRPSCNFFRFSTGAGAVRSNIMMLQLFCHVFTPRAR